MPPDLPPELVELIVGHLHGSRTLRFCALISRTWAIPCQRALFHDLHLFEYLEVVRLPAHLIRYPHLQRFIQHVSLRHSLATSGVPFVGPRPENVFTALFPLISHITSLDVTFDTSRRWDIHDQRFVEAFGAFVRQSESLKVLDIRGLGDKSDLQQMFSLLDDTQVQQLSLHMEFQHVQRHSFEPTLTIARLPAVESLRINSLDTLELGAGLNIWLGQHLAMFPKLKHLEIVMYGALDLDFWFSDILRPAALRLESFRLELTCSAGWDDPLPSHVNFFDSLQFNHLQLHIFAVEYKNSISRRNAQDMIDWFTAMFHHLVDAGSTIHFTELTFTFPDTAVKWEWVDHVLSYAEFGRVERIHFEEESHKGSLITNLEHPELVSAIRDAFPRLASRGVLCFE